MSRPILSQKKEIKKDEICETEDKKNVLGR